MAVSIYKINKGINKSIEFKGLKAQYIWYLGAGVIALLILFSVMYIAGLNQFICLGITLLLGTATVLKTYSMSRKYGEHGMMKAVAKRSVPKAVRVYSRKVFMKQ